MQRTHIGAVCGAHAWHRQGVWARAILPLQVIGMHQQAQHLQAAAGGWRSWRRW